MQFAGVDWSARCNLVGSRRGEQRAAVRLSGPLSGCPSLSLAIASLISWGEAGRMAWGMASMDPSLSRDAHHAPLCAGLQWRAPSADGQDSQATPGRVLKPTDLPASMLRAVCVLPSACCWALWRWLALLLREADVCNKKDSTLRQKSQTLSRFRVGRGSVSGRTMSVGVLLPPGRP